MTYCCSSLTPCYDLQPPREDFEEVWKPENYQTALTWDSVREELYCTCEARRVGMVVMKAFDGGDLLDAEWSPFGVAMQPEHCLHYALTRPATACVVGGFRSVEEVLVAVRYSDISDEQRDYAPFLSNVPHSYKGKCIYCGHCAPCSVDINIAMVNKLHDLTHTQETVPASVRDHYCLLDHHAGECIACGQCEDNCPFDVSIIEKMNQAMKVFGY